MAVSEDEGPDSQAQEKIHEQSGVSLTPSPTRRRATKRQALRDQERRLLDQGSRAVDRARATTAGTFWSRLNALAFMNGSLQFAALAVLCLFPFMIIVAAERGGDVRHVLIARLGLDQKATRDVDELMSTGSHAVTTLSIVGVAVVLLGALGIASNRPFVGARLILRLRPAAWLLCGLVTGLPRAGMSSVDRCRHRWVAWSGEGQREVRDDRYREHGSGGSRRGSAGAASG
jgi:hypothetical protein